MSNDFPLYTTDYISGVMSLRKPQSQSLKILEEITNAVQLRKGMNLKAALGAVHAMYPICSDFERDFMSLTFALATGVGKTRLMGAFIAYLYTQHHIRNFFVVAPNTTIFEKLKRISVITTAPSMCSRGLAVSARYRRSLRMTITVKKRSPCLNPMFTSSCITSINSTKRAQI